MRLRVVMEKAKIDAGRLKRKQAGIKNCSLSVESLEAWFSIV
jgi:hypothetical protein